MTEKEFALLQGLYFEQAVMSLLERAGCDVCYTGGSGDFGVDIVCIYDNIRIAIQCKYRNCGVVGNQAVQAVVGGMRLYACDRALVVTNQCFSRMAQIQAAANDVVLIDGQSLLDIVPNDTGNIELFDRLFGLVYKIED